MKYTKKWCKKCEKAFAIHENYKYCPHCKTKLTVEEFEKYALKMHHPLLFKIGLLLTIPGIVFLIIGGVFCSVDILVVGCLLFAPGFALIGESAKEPKPGSGMISF